MNEGEEEQSNEIKVEPFKDWKFDKDHFINAKREKPLDENKPLDKHKPPLPYDKLLKIFHMGIIGVVAMWVRLMHIKYSNKHLK